ncbi:MAG: M20/M25/M40 family metallo-hydrolase [Acidobacteriota bacterium]|nr:M20/M25/M40 family metallo-hydrolase [Acidobacteriota bacterium]
MIRKFLNLSLLLTIAIAALAQQPVATLNPSSADRLRKDVTYLASDALEGRRTGTMTAMAAARYVEDEFKRLGLKPGARREVSLSRKRGAVGYYDSYMQPFPYIEGVQLGKNNALRLNTKPDAPLALRVGEDWMPLGFSSNGEIERVPAVFVGFGITATDLKYDDYSRVDAAGKIAFAFAGRPDGDNPHSGFARYEEPRWKAIAAKNAGAKALILISLQEQFGDEPLSRLHYDNSAGDSGLPVVIISSRSFFRTLTGSDLSLVLKSVKQGIAPWVNFKGLVSLSVDINRREGPAANVIGILEGSDPSLKNEAIVIGAHYDHLGRGGEGSLAPREGEIHHGADDNASGVAGVLELARWFTSPGHRPRRTIVCMAFSGEEEGLLGSNYYVNHPTIPLANTVAMINMDMIGRMKDNKLIVGGAGTAQEWRQLVDGANPSERMRVTAIAERPGEAPKDSQVSDPASMGTPIVTGANGRTIVSVVRVKPIDITLTEDGYGPSDHSSFYAKKVPVLFLWTGTHQDYHKPSDTADKINYRDEARILSFVALLIHGIDSNDKRPAYSVAKSESTGRSMGFRVYLGTIPNYADSNDGLLLDGLRDDSPAAKAGLKAGDKIVKLAGRDVRNVYDYTYALGEMKAGQEYEIELLRGGERLKLKITPAARK